MKYDDIINAFRKTSFCNEKEIALFPQYLNTLNTFVNGLKTAFDDNKNEFEILSSLDNAYFECTKTHNFLPFVTFYLPKNISSTVLDLVRDVGILSKSLRNNSKIINIPATNMKNELAQLENFLDLSDIPPVPQNILRELPSGNKNQFLKHGGNAVLLILMIGLMFLIGRTYTNKKKTRK